MTNNKRDGFTLVELMLAMAFIAFMLLFIVAAILQVTRLYTKGMAIRQINQTGRQVIDTVGKSIRYAKPIYLPSYKRICVGGVTYAWNVEGEASSVYKNKLADSTQIRFISVEDSTAALCNTSTGSVVDISTTKAVSLVGGDITPMKFEISQRGNLWDLKIVLSTAGSNMAVVDASTPSGYSCSPNNEFCAFGDFETSIYARRD